MVRPGEEKIVKAMKEAKTAEEMVLSWMTQAPGRDREKDLQSLRLYLKRKPEMVETFAHHALTQINERGILDPKTRYLVILGIYMAMRHWRGVLPQACNAKAAGASEEEILEVAFLADYGAAKTVMVESAEVMAEVFENPSFQKIKKRNIASS